MGLHHGRHCQYASPPGQARGELGEHTPWRLEGFARLERDPLSLELKILVQVAHQPAPPQRRIAA